MPKEEKELVSFHVRAEKELKEAFFKRAKEKDTDASKLIRQFMKRWLKNNPPKEE